MGTIEGDSGLLRSPSGLGDPLPSGPPANSTNTGASNGASVTGTPEKDEDSKAPPLEAQDVKKMLGVLADVSKEKAGGAWPIAQTCCARSLFLTACHTSAEMRLGHVLFCNGELNTCAVPVFAEAPSNPFLSKP